MTCPTTPSFPPPGEQRARVVIKPALPSAACPRTSPGKHGLHPLSPSSKGKGGEGRTGRSKVFRRPQESGLDWPGHREGKGNKQTHPGEDFSTSYKNQRFRSPKS